MRAAGILTEEETGLIRLHGVASFLKSDLGQRMLKSKEVKREANFTMRIDPHAATMVQGIVDCVFKEDGEFVASWLSTCSSGWRAQCSPSD